MTVLTDGLVRLSGLAFVAELSAVEEASKLCKLAVAGAPSSFSSPNESTFVKRPFSGTLDFCSVESSCRSTGAEVVLLPSLPLPPTETVEVDSYLLAGRLVAPAPAIVFAPGFIEASSEVSRQDALTSVF